MGACFGNTAKLPFSTFGIGTTNTSSEHHKCYSLGDNKFGQQGADMMEKSSKHLILLNMYFPRDTNIQINTIKSGFYSTYIMCNDELLFVCGNNSKGQLGILNETTKEILLSWGQSEFIGDDILDLIVRYIGEVAFGKSLQRTLINTYSHKNIKFMSSGISSRHIFKYTQKNELYATGNNDKNQLSIWSDNELIRNFTEIKYFNKNNIILKKIECAYDYSIFLTDSGKMFSVGTSQYGGLGLGFGRNSVHQITSIFIQIKIISIACGYEHTLSLDVNQHVYSFGYNKYGQLGLGDNDDRYKPTLIKSLTKSKIEIVRIKCGNHFSVILDITGKVYCFGDNGCCQLGNGDDIKLQVNKPQRNRFLMDIDQICDIKCGFNHNVAETVNGDFYLWGGNECYQCLVFEPKSCIKLPTKFKGKGIGKIFKIYPGHKATRIVTI